MVVNILKAAGIETGPKRGAGTWSDDIRTHPRHLLNEYLVHYNTERAHQGVGKRPMTAPDPAASILPFNGEPVVRRERLGGLLHHFSRQQAA